MFPGIVPYACAAVVTAVFFYTTTCGHCVGIHTHTGFLLNALLNGIMWPISILSYMFLRKPLVFHQLDLLSPHPAQKNPIYREVLPAKNGKQPFINDELATVADDGALALNPRRPVDKLAVTVPT